MTYAEGWIPVALSDALEPGTSAGTLIDGSEIVVWRDTKGDAHVWEDRCPHRGMRMSFGFVRGDHIACLYHGWQYDAAGQCQYIPAHPDLEVPKTIKVPTFAAREQNGIIWTALTADLPTAAIPADETGFTPVRTIHIDRASTDVLTALQSARLPAFGDAAADAPTVFSKLSDRLLTLTAGSDRLLVAIQSCSQVKTALHLVILGSPTTYQGAGQKHFSRFAESLRHSLENKTHDRIAEPA